MYLEKKVLYIVNQLSVWLSFQLSIVFFIGIPISLFFWSMKKGNRAINQLLSNYWTVSLLFFISIILLIGEYNFALLITNISTLLMTISVWFWNNNKSMAMVSYIYIFEFYYSKCSNYELLIEY